MNFIEFEKREIERERYEEQQAALSSFYDKDYQEHRKSVINNLPVSSDYLTFKKVRDNRKFQDIRNTIYRTRKVLTNKKTGNQFSLESLHQQNLVRDKAFLQNRMNTLFSYLNDFDLMFFTLTEKSSVHRSYSKMSDTGKLATIVKSNNKYNSFMRSYLKNRLFKTLNTTKRFYVRAKEMHKSFMLHEHCSFFVPQENLIESFSLLLRTWLKEDLGRLEVVLDSKFKSYFEQSELWFEHTLINKKTNKRDQVFIPCNQSHLISRGEFFYVKFLTKSEEGSQKLQLLKYVMKYVLKNSYLDDDKIDYISEIERSIFLKLKIKPISFSQFLFPKYLYFGLKSDHDNTAIYDNYTLRELTDLKNSGKVKYFYDFDNIEVERFVNVSSNYSSDYKYREQVFEKVKAFISVYDCLVSDFVNYSNFHVLADSLNEFNETHLMLNDFDIYSFSIRDLLKMGYSLEMSSFFSRYLDRVEIETPFGFESYRLQASVCSID